MPVYNNEEILEVAIQSILEQSIYGLELILINDGSTDSSAQICADFVKKEPLIVDLIDFSDRRGFSKARNQGLLRSKGKYVYFANPNDRFDAKMLEANIKLAEEKETDMVVFGFTTESKNHSNVDRVKLPNLPFLSNQEHFRRHFRNFYHFYPYELFNKLYKREYLIKNRVNFIDVKAREDAFFNLRVYKNINSVAFNRTAYCFPHKNNFSISRNNKNNHYATNIKLAYYFKEIMEYWQHEDEFEDLIAREFIHVVLAELEAVSDQNNSLSLQEQIEHIDRIINERTIIRYLNNSEVRKDYNPYQRALLMTLGEGNSERAIQMTKNKDEFTSKTSKIKRLIRNFVNSRS